MARVIVASKRPVWIVLTVALLIHISLISLQGQGRRRIDTSFVRVWILDSLAPMEKLADRSLYGVRNRREGHSFQQFLLDRAARCRFAERCRGDIANHTPARNRARHGRPRSGFGFHRR